MMLLSNLHNINFRGRQAFKELDIQFVMAISTSNTEEQVWPCTAENEIHLVDLEKLLRKLL